MIATQPIATFPIATLDEEIYSPFPPGIEYTLSDNRLHLTTEGIGHYTFLDNKLHYTLLEEN